MSTPSEEQVRQALAHLDPRQQKIVCGMIVVMIKNPTRVQDREWITEQLTEITLLTCEADGDAEEVSVQVIQDFLMNNTSELLNGAFLLFQRVAVELEPKAQSEDGFTFEEAMQLALAYLPAAENPESN